MEKVDILRNNNVQVDSSLEFWGDMSSYNENLKEYKVTTFVGVPLIIESMYKKIMAKVEKENKTKKLKFGLKISKILMKFKIDIRRKIFKE